MSIAIVPPRQNGTKPALALRLVPALGQKIDDLRELRSLIRQSQEAERRLTAEVLSALKAAALSRLAGARAIAIVDQRANLKPDPELFLSATGKAGYGAVSVSVTAARKFLGESDLAAISETITTSVLRVEAIPTLPTEAVNGAINGAGRS